MNDKKTTTKLVRLPQNDPATKIVAAELCQIELDKATRAVGHAFDILKCAEVVLPSYSARLFAIKDKLAEVHDSAEIFISETAAKAEADTIEDDPTANISPEEISKMDDEKDGSE